MRNFKEFMLISDMSSLICYPFKYQ